MVCCVIGYHSRYISPDSNCPNITLGRIWKCCDKIRKFYFILGFGYSSDVLMGALDQGQDLIGGKSCIT